MSLKSEVLDTGIESIPKRKSKTLKVTLMTLGVLFFSCCGLPYCFFWVTAPVNWTYRLDSEIPTHPDLEYLLFLRGDADYFQDESGPRRVMLTIHKKDETSQHTVRLLSVEATSSATGPIAAHTAGTLPTPMGFGDGAGEVFYWAHWHGDIDFDIEPSSQESIRVNIVIEITDGNGTITTAELEALFVPKREFHPISRRMPSA